MYPPNIYFNIIYYVQQIKVNGAADMIYLDNAATTLFKPHEVYFRSDSVFKNFSANAGRSGHQASIMAAELIYSARKTISDFLFLDAPERVIFTFGCTDSLNILIRGLFKDGDHIITSAYEHNSVLRPLEFMKNKGIEYSVLYPDNGFYISDKQFKNAIKKNTKAMIFNYVSNVNGFVQPINEYAKIAKEYGLLFIADCAQAAGIQDMNIDCDYFCIAGHKSLYGPQGIGILGIKKDVPLPIPLRFGGTGNRTFDLIQPSDMPEYLESGTLSVQNISALEEGVKFISKRQKKIYEHETHLAQFLIDNLKTNKKIKLYSPRHAKSGVIAFNIGTKDSNEIADILDKRYSICVRGGFHCAPLCHKFLGTEDQGAVRISLSMFNTEKELHYLLNVLELISKNRG